PLYLQCISSRRNVLKSHQTNVMRKIILLIFLTTLYQFALAQLRVYATAADYLSDTPYISADSIESISMDLGKYHIIYYDENMKLQPLNIDHTEMWGYNLKKKIYRVDEKSKPRLIYTDGKIV